MLRFPAILHAVPDLSTLEPTMGSISLSTHSHEASQVPKIAELASPRRANFRNVGLRLANWIEGKTSIQQLHHTLQVAAVHCLVQ